MKPMASGMTTESKVNTLVKRTSQGKTTQIRTTPMTRKGNFHHAPVPVTLACLQHIPKPVSEHLQIMVYDAGGRTNQQPSNAQSAEHRSSSTCMEEVVVLIIRCNPQASRNFLTPLARTRSSQRGHRDTTANGEAVAANGGSAKKRKRVRVFTRQTTSPSCRRWWPTW